MQTSQSSWFPGLSNERLTRWQRLSLAHRFALVSFAVLVLGMLVIGWWVSTQIQHGVVRNTATATALYMNSFIAPEVGELERQRALSVQTREELTRLHRDTPLSSQIPSFKIWGENGLVVYSSRPGMVGRIFPVTDNLAKAWAGQVSAEFSDLQDEENASERRFGERLLEIYSPIRAKGTDHIIAVAEFYSTATELEAQLLQARLLSWLIVGGVTLAMFAVLFTIVRGGSLTIQQQQNALSAQVAELSSLLRQNQILHDRVRSANNRALEINERFLRRVSAELHDGPAQALGFALLRLDAVKQAVATSLAATPQSDAARAGTDLDNIRGALDEALHEIRNLSAGLALPELGEMNLRQALERLLRTHERRSQTRVEAQFHAIPDDLPLPLKIGVYRFAQEALHNAARHGGGVEQKLSARVEDSSLTVTVSDAGPGFDAGDRDRRSDRLGLAGMRERIESLGGSFTLMTEPGQGTRVVAVLPLNWKSGADA